MRLLVVDNSTKEEISSHNRLCLASNEGMTKAQYLSLPDNPGLSVAYNRGVEEIVRNGCFGTVDTLDYLLVLDDDTTLNEDYLRAVEQCVAQKDAPLYLPLVYDELGLMSPVRLKTLVAKRFVSEAEALRVAKEHPEELSGINSGMVIRMDLFENHRYNEQMFMDYIDHRWILDLRKEGIVPKVISGKLEQNFSATQDTKKQAWDRFARQKKDLRIFYQGHGGYYAYVVAKKTLKLWIKYGF